jgi:hypothetical protein
MGQAACPILVGKNFAVCVEGFGNSWNDFWPRGLHQDPPTNFDMILPFSAESSSTLQSYITGGYISTNVMKKATPDRVRELLRVVDYLAKPFGTQEDLLITYGLAPADYTIGPDGNPGIPKYAKHVNEVEKVIVDRRLPWRT